MTDTTMQPGTELVPTGQVTVCCGLHKPGDWGTCCTGDDCTPCCERCPTCPLGANSKALAAQFDRDWRGLANLAGLIDAMLRSRP